MNPELFAADPVHADQVQVPFSYQSLSVNVSVIGSSYLNSFELLSPALTVRAGVLTVPAAVADAIHVLAFNVKL